jgi:AcrR family transcriptional regulator
MATLDTVRRRGPRKTAGIFAATLQLLREHGYDGLTIESVAARAGVNKTTIYRWWPSKGALLAAALVDSELLTSDIPDTGTLRGDLIALAESVAELLTGSRTGALVAALRAAVPRSPELTELSYSLFADRLIREQAIFHRAVERRELSPSANSKTIIDVLEGALWFRLLLRGETMPPNYIGTIIDTILNGLSVPGCDPKI